MSLPYDLIFSSTVVVMKASKCLPFFCQLFHVEDLSIVFFLYTLHRWKKQEPLVLENQCFTLRINGGLISRNSHLNSSDWECLLDFEFASI